MPVAMSKVCVKPTCCSSSSRSRTRISRGSRGWHASPPFRSARTKASTRSDIEAHERCGGGGVSLKLIKLGGMSAAVEAAQLCQRLGLSNNIAAKIAESSIASAAAIHRACAAPAVDWGVSLTHFYLAEDIARDALALSAGTVALPAGPGLGIE